MNNERIILEMLDRIKILEEEIEKLKNNLISNSKAVNYKNGSEMYKQSIGTKDSTKYIFNGVRYGKNRLVLNIVKEYFKRNPDLTVLELENIFDYSLQGNRNYGVLKRKEDALKIRDYRKRFFADEEIKVKDGTILVCTQWGIDNINNFIARAEQLNFSIIKVA